MGNVQWEGRKVYGRDEVLREIEKRADQLSKEFIENIRNIMNDYEVDIYRLVLAVGRRYGMDVAYEIMSDTVAEKRLKWLDQRFKDLYLSGTDLEKGLELFIKYFKPEQNEFEIIERSEKRVILRRKDFVNVISHACEVLGLDIIEVCNKVYARATNFMLKRINPKLRHVVLDYKNGWYKEMIELIG